MARQVPREERVSSKFYRKLMSEQKRLRSQNGENTVPSLSRDSLERAGAGDDLNALEALAVTQADRAAAPSHVIESMSKSVNQSSLN